MLQASKQEAILAVRLYNDPSRERALEGFIIHMHIAWLYAFQAKWMKQGLKYHVIKSERPLRYKHINGERMSQSLEWFVGQEYPQTNSPVRANLEFFISLRNKIEHRHTGKDEALLSVVSGECHAMLLNFEEFVTSFAGNEHSLAHALHFPVFIGGFTDQGKRDLAHLTQTLPADLRKFLTEFDSNLEDDVARDPRFCMRLTILLESGNRKGDLALKFVNYEELTHDERKAAEQIASNHGYVITKTKSRPVANLGLFKPGQVAKTVQDSTPFIFNASYHFANFWKKHSIRPPRGDIDPTATRSEFCVYDETHDDYLYTQACIRWLTKKCQTEAGYIEATGIAPTPKVATD